MSPPLNASVAQWRVGHGMMGTGIMSSAPLFDERPPFERERLAAKLGALAAQGILIGTSSWKYPGWLGQI